MGRGTISQNINARQYNAVRVRIGISQGKSALRSRTTRLLFGHPVVEHHEHEIFLFKKFDNHRQSLNGQGGFV